MKTESAQVAAIIRKEMKSNGIAGTVRSRNFAGGDAVDVSVTDLAPWQVQALTSFADGFRSGDFDGMTDSYNYRRDAKGPTAKYVHVAVSYSDTVRAAAWDYLCHKYAGFNGAPKSHTEAGSFRNSDMNDYADVLLYRVLNGSLGQFWTKPRTRTAPAIAIEVAA